MSKPSLFTKLIVAGASLWLAVPAPALAALNPDPQSAAVAGIQYLTNSQQADGSISGFGGESDWTVEAVQARGQQASAFTHGGASLLDFLKADVPTPGTTTTALERKIIAIAAAGQNPESFGGMDYMSLLSAQHLGGQIGDATLLNDDTFGVIAVDAAHDSSLLPEAQDALNYLLAHQGADGGFGYKTDPSIGSDGNDTAAAIVAMYAASDLGLGSSTLDAAESKALTYLLGTQQADGGFGYDAFSPSDGDSTAWALMALNTESNVSSSASSARTWLLNNQNPDGGFTFGAYGTTDSDTYTTAHAVIALLGTTWLLHPAPAGTGGQAPQPPAGSGTGSGTTSTPAPTTTASTQPATKPSAGWRLAFGHGEPGGTTSNDNHTTPKVKAASTTALPRINANNPIFKHGNGNAKPDRTLTVYAVILLGLVAAIWFMLESRKTRGASNET